MSQSFIPRAAIAALCAASLSACASTSTADQTALGHYRMPVARFDLQVTYQLTSCPSDRDLRSPETAAMRVNITAVSSAVAGVDPGGPFAISRSHVSSARTAGEATIAFYPNRTIQSINVKSEDRTGAILTNIIGAVSSVARITGLPLSSSGAVAVQPCTTDAIAALGRVRLIDRRIAAIETGLTAEGDVDEDRLSAARTEIEALRADRTASVSRSLSFTRTFEFTPSRTALSASFRPVTTGTFVSPAVDAEVLPQLVVGVRLDPIEPVPNSASVRPTPSESQLVLREPVFSRLFVCRPECGAGAGRPAAAIHAADVMVPQLGEYRLVELRAGWFQNRTMEIAFGSFGDVETLKLTGNAQGEAASEQLAAALERLRTARDEVAADGDTRETAERTREAALIDAERAVLEARRRLREEVARGAGE